MEPITTIIVLLSCFLVLYKIFFHACNDEQEEQEDLMKFINTMKFLQSMIMINLHSL